MNSFEKSFLITGAAVVFETVMAVIERRLGGGSIWSKSEADQKLRKMKEESCNMASLKKAAELGNLVKQNSPGQDEYLENTAIAVQMHTIIDDVIVGSETIGHLIGKNGIRLEDVEKGGRV